MYINTQVRHHRGVEEKEEEEPPERSLEAPQEEAAAEARLAKASPTDAWLMTSPLGTPRGRCGEYSNKIFPQLRNQGLSIRRGETND
jgi:hypothetical protein